jgi:signal transduction histidine kinase
VATTSAVGGQGVERQPPTEAQPLARGFVLAMIALDVAALLWGAVETQQQFYDAGWGLLAWSIAVAAVGVAALPFESGEQLGLDMPLLLAAGYVFGPFVAGSIAFVAYLDPREFRREISLVRALFNRAQTSLSTIAATAVFLAMGGGSGRWPLALAAALAAVGVDCLVNYGSVVVVLSLHERVSVRESLSRLHFGAPTEFALTYVSFGLLSLMLAEIYEAVGGWSLATFAIPVVLARQAFSRTREVEGMTRRVEAQASALREVSSTIADERRDERLRIAAGLHDEVLPPLYKVHLMGEVLKQNLAAGRLLTLEEDLPELLRATEAASESMRTVIGSLRDSTLGTDGLERTLRLLIEHLERQASVRIRLTACDVPATPLVQLLAYQVAREALTNALKHSQCTEIRVTLSTDDANLRLVVEDDGVGFAPESVDTRAHLGITLMRERVELAGGVLHVNSRQGEGTQIVARLPATQLRDD